MTDRNPSDLIDGLLPTTEPQACDAMPCAPDGERRKRKNHVRVNTFTESMHRLPKYVLHRDAAMYPSSINAEYEDERPKTRGDCLPGGCNEARPCPWVACRYNLYLSVNEVSGSITYNFPDADIDEIPATCVLDVADRGGLTLEEVGNLMNRTRELVRQQETKGLRRLKVLQNVLDAGDAFGVKR